MQVVSEHPNEGTVTVRSNSGVVLTLRKASRYVLQDILFKLGFASAGTPDEMAAALAKQDRTSLAAESLRWFNYCAAYGVASDPPDAAMKELQAMGFDTSSPTVARANWLRVFVLEDEQEAALLSAIVTGLTFGVGRLGGSVKTP